MNEAYSRKLKRIVCVDEVTDFSDTFTCLYHECNAEYIVRAVNSSIISRHFSRRSSTPHVKGCPYIISNSSYVNNDSLIKKDIEQIYEHTSKRCMVEKNVNEDNSISKHDKTFSNKITTPKQLLCYCISNSLSTEYKDNIKVDDIIIDERNICSNANFQGFDGLRLLVGHTYKFDKSEKTIDIKVTTRTKNKKEICLNVTIFLSEEQLKEIVDYILTTYDKFSNHSIAVLGLWENDKKYHVRCDVNKKANVIYKFVKE